ETRSGKVRRERRNILQRGAQSTPPIVADTRTPRAIDTGLDLFDEDAQRVASLGDHLATEQIHAVNPGRTFVNRVELLIAQPRLGQILAAVAVATVHLDRERIR